MLLSPVEKNKAAASGNIVNVVGSSLIGCTCRQMTHLDFIVVAFEQLPDLNIFTTRKTRHSSRQNEALHSNYLPRRLALLAPNVSLHDLGKSRRPHEQ